MTRTSAHIRDLSPMAVPVSPAAMARARDMAKTIPSLKTARLTLRPPQLADFGAYAQIVCTGRGRFVGGPMTGEDAWDDFARMVATWPLRGHGVWAVSRNETVMGFVLIGCEPGDRAHELGFLFLAEGEGNGYAYEAASAARDFAHDTLGLQELVSYCDPANTRAASLAERLGGTESETIDGFTCYRYWGSVQ
ncbi:MAG: GNAT family N-acetyltransferase [Pseudomonadota bacterium]